MGNHTMMYCHFCKRIREYEPLLNEEGRVFDFKCKECGRLKLGEAYECQSCGKLVPRRYYCYRHERYECSACIDKETKSLSLISM